MSEPARAEGDHPGTALRWVAGASALGGLELGLIVNWISDTYQGAAAPAVTRMLLLVVLVALVLRQLPDQAPIQRLVARVALTGAALAAVASLLVPSPWLVLAAAALAMIACLTRHPGELLVSRLLGVAGIGLGVALIGAGAAALVESILLLGVAFISSGVAGIGLGFRGARPNPAGRSAAGIDHRSGPGTRWRVRFGGGRPSTGPALVVWALDAVAVGHQRRRPAAGAPDPDSGPPEW